MSYSREYCCTKKFSIMETADLVTFTEEILNEKLHFLCAVYTFHQHVKKHVSPL